MIRMTAKIPTLRTFTITTKKTMYSSPSVNIVRNIRLERPKSRP